MTEGRTHLLAIEEKPPFYLLTQCAKENMSQKLAGRSSTKVFAKSQPAEPQAEEAEPLGDSYHEVNLTSIVSTNFYHKSELIKQDGLNC